MSDSQSTENITATKETTHSESKNQATSSSSFNETTTSSELTKTAKPDATKKVNIVIAGKNYPINCPANEEDELRRAVYYINNFVLGIKQDAPHLNQENLLVLCCLNLYEQINAHQESSNSQRQLSQEADALLNKIIKEAQSIVS